MERNDDTDRRLSRRSLLAGLGTVGLASAGAGLGTTALLSDTESFTNNTTTAGSLNLAVSVDIRGRSAELPDPVVESSDGPNDTADGNVVTITLADVKPGDWLCLEWDAEVYGNPGYVQVTSVDADYANDEGANPEAETDTTAPGDLGDALLTTVWQDFVAMGGGFGDRADLVDLDETTNNSTTALSAYEQPNEDGETTAGAHYTTANEAHDVYETGVTLRDPGTGEPLVVGHGGDSATFYELFELPSAVGNEIQGDELTFTLRFDAQQVRHNDDPFASP